ncbi:MAG: damage-inducible protein DinB [Gemmatimonadetes bacterium]|nr:damage-inducible protein DinB [Gemmatimonadota bacterium]
MGRYAFLTDTYETERLKTLSVWSEFAEGDLGFRPAPLARTPREQMVHQCVSEDTWFRTMLGIDLGEPPLPAEESRQAFMTRYAAASARRLADLRARPDGWYEGEASFFGVPRPRTWILVRRFTHSAHHRAQLTTYLRLLGKPLYSTYGPTADTGGLFTNQAPVIYRYPDVETLLEREAEGGEWPPLPGPGDTPPTERP